MSVLDGPGEGTWSVFASKIAEQRDALEDRLEQMTRERDKEREEWEARRCECSASDFCAIAKERDEARAKLAAISSLHGALAAINAMARERDEALAEVERLRALPIPEEP